MNIILIVILCLFFLWQENLIGVGSSEDVEQLVKENICTTLLVLFFKSKREMRIDETGMILILRRKLIEIL